MEYYLGTKKNKAVPYVLIRKVFKDTWLGEKKVKNRTVCMV